ncbi:uncharacterized protein [Dermacentor albipictus]|uniref:uncharacterized protein isoform X2 n=1 Tax=Dermacentor albipictus TaxID=60249 RepID=UPI0031FDAFB7
MFSYLSAAAHSSTVVDVSHCFEPSRLHDYWIRRHLNLGGRSRTVVAAVSLPAVRMKQLHNRRSVASHQFPFSAIEGAFLPVLHPVTDHSNDLGRIVTQEEVRLAPSLVGNEEMALHINSCLLVVITSLLA